MTTQDEQIPQPQALVPRADDPGRLGAEAAEQIVTAQASSGVSTGRMARTHEDTAAWLWSEATTPEALQFAKGYEDTALSLVAELREAEHPLPAPGSPHPDPVLAAKGWHVSPDGPGVYVRRQAESADMEREAG